MTNLKEAKTIINKIINDNKKQYFQSKTVYDIAKFSSGGINNYILLSVILPITASIFIPLSIFLTKHLSNIFPSLISILIILFTIFGVLSFIGTSTFLFKLITHKCLENKIRKIENGHIDKEKIKEETFEKYFWKNEIDSRTHLALKDNLPSKLYLMLYSKRPSGLLYSDVYDFLNNIEKHQKRIKDIENDKISLNENFVNRKFTDNYLSKELIDMDEFMLNIPENVSMDDKIDEELENALKILTPPDLYLMLRSQNSADITYNDINTFLNNLSKYEKEIEDAKLKEDRANIFSYKIR